MTCIEVKDLPKSLTANQGSERTTKAAMSKTHVSRDAHHHGIEASKRMNSPLPRQDGSDAHQGNGSDYVRHVRSIWMWSGTGLTLFGSYGRKFGDLLFHLLAPAVRALQSDRRQVGDVKSFGEFLMAIEARIHVLRHKTLLPTSPSTYIVPSRARR